MGRKKKGAQEVKLLIILAALLALAYQYVQRQRTQPEPNIPTVPRNGTDVSPADPSTSPETSATQGDDSMRGQSSSQAGKATDTVPVSVPVPYHEPRWVKRQPYDQRLLRYSYSASYNMRTLCPNWVGWLLTAAHTDGKYARGGHKFLEDREVPRPRALYSDIRESESGYQRGHMCPAQDNKWAYKAQKDAFLMTNICPQNGDLNQQDWKYLEERCRKWAQRFDSIYIVAGPIFRSNTFHTVGKNGVGVPDAFFKVVYIPHYKSGSPFACGFLYENTSTLQPISYYVRSVREVEQATGLDFFHQLPDDVENAVEQQVPPVE